MGFSWPSWLASLVTSLISLWDAFKIEAALYIVWFKGKSEGLLQGDLKNAFKTILEQENVLKLKNEYEKIDTTPNSLEPDDILARLRDDK